jgi:CRISPR type IV-associated protein Csf1
MPSAGHCAMCGLDLPKGSPCSPFKPGPTFIDYPALAARSDYVCGYCMALWNKPFMARAAKAIITTEGVFKLWSNDDLTLFLLEPPKPPFVAYLADAKGQHLIWRTPVSLSRDLFTLRLGTRKLVLRRPAYLQGVQDCALIEAATAATGKKKAVRLPFLDARDLDQPAAGRMREDVRRSLEEAGAADALAAFARVATLTAADRWAIGRIAGRTPSSHFTRIDFNAKKEQDA